MAGKKKKVKEVVTKIEKPVPDNTFVVVYLDTDDQLKLEKLTTLELVSDFISEAKIKRSRYILVYGEFLYGPRDVELRVPEAYIAENDEPIDDLSRVSEDTLDELLPNHEDEED